jgi:hypothetical protein
MSYSRVSSHLKGVAILVLLFLNAPRAAAIETQPYFTPVDDTIQTLCTLVETSAKSEGLPVAYFTRLIWRESSFRVGVTSPAGAQGVAQFMPGTAGERGLANPFDPEKAIPESAKLLSELLKQFGNLGLAAAAYNAGPTALAKWLADERGMPLETEDYVLAITGRPLSEWSQTPPPSLSASSANGNCGTIVAEQRASATMPPVSGLFAPWGVQLAGSFSKRLALLAFARMRQRYAGVIGDAQPFVLGSHLRYRGGGLFFRVRLPAQTRGEAAGICRKLHAIGGACIVLRS